MMSDLVRLRDTLQLLQQRCQAYHQWDAAFKNVLAATSQQQQQQASADADSTPAALFQRTAEKVGHVISHVSVSLRDIQQKAEAEAASSTAAATTTKASLLRLSRFINEVQQRERAKFEATAALQKLVMAHMRGEGCNEFVHEHECAVYNDVCFSFIGGSRVAQVTASASMHQRRRVDAETGVPSAASAARGIEASSSSDDDDDNKKDGEKGQPPQSKFADPAAGGAAGPDMRDCVAVSRLVTELQRTIRACESAVSDITEELQAELVDASEGSE